MKRLFAVLLALLILLSLAACGEEGTTARRFSKEDEEPMKKDAAAAQYLADFIVRAAEYPALPDMPDAAELDAAFGSL